MSTDKKPRRFGTGVLVATIGLSVLAAGLLALGGALLWANGKKDDSGYLSTSGHPFAASGYAIATDNLDVDLGGAESLLPRDGYGKVRIAADASGGKPVFVGIARTSDVSAYLGGTSYSSVTDISDSPFAATYAAHSGSRRPATPAGQPFWAASTHGLGHQAVTWDVKDGDWSVVVMNDDASPHVAASVSAAASVPFLRTLALCLLGAALLAALAAGTLALKPRRVAPAQG